MSANRIQDIFWSIRPGHAVKNMLLFLPLVFADKLGDPASVLKSCLAFVFFTLAASSVYILNDILDLQNDKNHPTKSRRPLAQGKVDAPPLLILASVFSLISVVGSWLILGQPFLWVLLAYFILNFAYSLYLKYLVIIDVLVLSSFYIMRVLAGTLALDVRISHWMIICVALLAMFLGFNKRRSEIQLLGASAPDHRSVLSHYSPYFIDQMIPIITASTIICYTLYTIDAETVARFNTHNLLFTVPFVYYGIFRYLYLVHKQRKSGDLVRILFSDKMTLLNVICWFITSVLVVYIF